MQKSDFDDPPFGPWEQVGEKAPRSLDELAISRQLIKYAYLSKGMVVVAGPDSLEKMAVQAALFDERNLNLPGVLYAFDNQRFFDYIPKKSSALVQVDTREDGEAFHLNDMLDRYIPPTGILLTDMSQPTAISRATRFANERGLVVGNANTETVKDTIDYLLNTSANPDLVATQKELQHALKAVIFVRPGSEGLDLSGNVEVVDCNDDAWPLLG